MDTKEKKKMQNKEKKEMHARVSQSIKEVSRIYREEANLDGSRIYRPDIKFLNGSKSYRDKFQKA